YPGWKGHVWSAPDVSLLIRPRVDRAAVANQLEQAWFAELLGGQPVQTLERRHDHGVVEQPAKTLLVGDIPLDVAGERVVVRDHAAERQKRARHPAPGIAEP